MNNYFSRNSFDTNERCLPNNPNENVDYEHTHTSTIPCASLLLKNNDDYITFPGVSSLNNSDIDNSFNNGRTINTDPCEILKSIRVSNINRLIIGQLNINSLQNKFEDLKIVINGNLDILVLTETKLDYTFLKTQFIIEGYMPPFRFDRPTNGGGVIIYVRDDIPCRKLKPNLILEHFEGIFLEINLRKTKWLLFGGYNPYKENITYFLNQLGPAIDQYIPHYDNLILLGDFNSETCETCMTEFCDTYNLSNLIKDPTCFKNPLNPSSIDVILTNRIRSFQYSKVIETGLSDCHMMTITVLKSFFQKQKPKMIKYRDYRKFDEFIFRSELHLKLSSLKENELNYENFENVFVGLLNIHAPMKEKYIRANNAPFMNKILSKAVMTRSRLRNIFLKNPCETNKINYNKHRNFCTRLFKKEKKKFYDNLDIKQITDNKKFWKTVKPLFSEKQTARNNITLIENDIIISKDLDVAETMNYFFSNAVKELNINGSLNENFSYNSEHDDILNMIDKFKHHPSVLKIKQNVRVSESFHFSASDVDEISKKINNLDIKKPTTYNNIPTRLLVESNDIAAPFITTIFNKSIANGDFPSLLKLADITPTYKKDDTSKKENYRPVSILTPVSKFFERSMHDQIALYMETYLSPFLCGFRKGYSTQNCLMVMLERWKKALDKQKIAGALLTDLSKAFDCLNHELIIAKLDAYGFDFPSLAYIYSYLCDRKQRTKVNNSFSTWSSIKCGVPQGSILGPLLFNIYLNDIFYFIDKTKLTNYADDNTPYAIELSIETLINSLEHDTSILIKWFRDNYLKLNADKCHLLITKHSNDVSVNVEDEIIIGSQSVKLLGVTIDNKLDFNEHVSKICKKVSTKLHALARISHFMTPEKLRLILKAFIESQFSYCPLLWMFHSRALNNRINRLHERALRLVYKDSRLTFDELLQKDKSFTIHHRNLQKLAIEMFKIKNNESPLLMKSIFPDTTNPRDLRNKNPFQSNNVHSVYNGTETISFRGPKTWALVPDVIKQSKSLLEFKRKIKQWKPIGCSCRLCKTYVNNIGFI